MARRCLKSKHAEFAVVLYRLQKFDGYAWAGFSWGLCQAWAYLRVLRGAYLSVKHQEPWSFVNVQQIYFVL
jgi:hypothetical protein